MPARKPIKANPVTGEVIVWTPPVVDITIPDPKTVTDINKAVGKNPPVDNLKDHDEFNGQKILVVKVLSYSDGMDTASKYPGKPWGKFACFIYPEGVTLNNENASRYYHELMTGSGNVFARIMAANTVLPVEGVLRKAGRAWLLD